MIRITHGDTVIECDNREDFLEAVEALNEYDARREARNTRPAWAVGGPVEAVPYGLHEEWAKLPPELSLVELSVVADRSESKDSVVQHVLETGRHVPVSRANHEVLEAVMLFPEGVGTANICQLLGLGKLVVGGRIQALKAQGLIEKAGHNRSRQWRATSLARRGKLVVA